MSKKVFVFFLIGIFIIINNIGLCQEKESSLSESNQTEFQWVWGEVVNIDLQQKTILLKYLDYETDTEKEISLIVDENTTYEGVNSLLEIKPHDTVSIDYVIDSGKNIARNISVEKFEDTTSEATPPITKN